jgi:uncharacterized membrane-anchored protein YhcB (DUF1043 family)
MIFGQACLKLTEEQSMKLVTVNKRFQQQREMLDAQRQGIHARLQRSSESASAFNTLVEDFLKVRTHFTHV